MLLQAKAGPLTILSSPRVVQHVLRREVTFMTMSTSQGYLDLITVTQRKVLEWERDTMDPERLRLCADQPALLQLH